MKLFIKARCPVLPQSIKRECYVSIQLVLPQFRIPAVEKRDISGYITSAPALPQSLTFGFTFKERRIYMYFSFVSICKYLLTAGLREQNIDVMQSWPGILQSSCTVLYSHRATRPGYADTTREALPRIFRLF